MTSDYRWSNQHPNTFTAGNIIALLFLCLEKLFKQYGRNYSISEKDFVKLKIDEMVNLYDAMRIKQDKSSLLTKEYFQWYIDASDIFRKLKQS